MGLGVCVLAPCTRARRTRLLPIRIENGLEVRRITLALLPDQFRRVHAAFVLVSLVLILVHF